MEETQRVAPKRVFIVPYRNRIQHKFFFSKYMSFILEDQDDYEIYFSHQCDARTFNRGAVRNIGFLAVKEKYPNDYKDITFIFNDVDTIPFNKIFDYQTTPGTLKHYYGYKYALGGIVVVKGHDFEKLNGYPCYWGWGMEDNALQKRCDRLGLKIDRSSFYKIGSPEILQLFDGISRIISKKDPWRSTHDNGIDGLATITKLKYSIDKQSDNPNDNIFTVLNDRIFIINIYTFLTHVRFEADQFYNYDLREPKRQIINPHFIKETRQIVSTTDDWTNIPYYPTSREKREMEVKEIIAQGKPVPETLMQQLEQDTIKEIKNDVYNNFNTSHIKTREIVYDDDGQNECEEQNQEEQPVMDNRMMKASIYNQNYQQLMTNIKQNYHPQHQHHPNNYQHHHPNLQHPNQQHHPNNYQQHHPNHHYKQPHKYSPEYANYIGQQPKAQASARIRLGGVY